MLTSRCTQPSINPNLHVGKPRSPFATDKERASLAKVQALLGTARRSTTSTEYFYNVSEAMRLCRNILVARKAAK